MRLTDDPSVRHNRAMLALGVAALHLLLGYVLLVGLAGHLPARIEAAITVISLRPPPAPVQPKAPKPEGDAAPAAREARAAPVVAPPPVVPVEPPPILAAPVAGPADAVTSGAAPLPGPGAGGGGEGFGLGNGGDGAGGGGTPARWLSGRIKPSDYPEREFDDGVEGITGVRLTISARGRVTECAVTHPSGSDTLDETTCRLLIKRSRYEPARDASGRPIEGVEDGAQEWRVQTRDRDGDR